MSPEPRNGSESSLSGAFASVTTHSDPVPGEKGCGQTCVKSWLRHTIIVDVAGNVTCRPSVSSSVKMSNCSKCLLLTSLSRVGHNSQHMLTRQFNIQDLGTQLCPALKAGTRVSFSSQLPVTNSDPGAGEELRACGANVWVGIISSHLGHQHKRAEKEGSSESLMASDLEAQPQDCTIVRGVGWSWS